MTKRRLEKLTACPNVFQIMIWDEGQQKWVPPASGMRFRAFGYEKDDAGKTQRLGRYFDTLALAKVFALRSQRQGIRVEVPKIEASNPESGMRFGELIKAWQEVWLPSKNMSTQIRYKSYLQHFHFFWNMPVEKLSPSDIDRWIVELKKPEYLAKGHTTRCDYKHEFSVLRGILNFYASRFNRNYRLPFLKDHKSMLKVREKVKVSKDLNVDELQSFMASLKQVCAEFDCEVVYYLAFMQYATYCRVQEAAALHYEDFDFTRGKLTISNEDPMATSQGLRD